MRRLMVLVTVALVMAAMMALFSMGAVAQPNSSNACEGAANQGGTGVVTDNQTGGEFGEIASSAAQSGGQEFGETIKGISSVCRQG